MRPRARAPSLPGRTRKVRSHDGGGGGLVGVDQPDLGPGPARLAHRSCRPCRLVARALHAPEDAPGRCAARVSGGRAGVSPMHRRPARGLGRGADGPVQARGAQAVEEGVAGVALHQAHGAGVGVGQDRLGAVLGDDPPPAVGDALDGLVPGDGGEGAAALGPGGQQGGGEPARGMHRVLVAGHLGAEGAPAVGVVRVAPHRHGAALRHLHQQAAGVGAVEGAGGAVRGHGRASRWKG